MSAAFAELTGYASVRPFLLVVVLSFLTCVPQTGIDRSTRVQAAWALVVTALVFLWRLRYGSLSIWSVTVGWLPGLSAIRDPGRVIYVYELAAALLAAGFLARARTRRPARVIATLSMTALLVMTWNWPTLEYKRPIQVFERWVAAPIAIPPSCRSFFVLGASNEYMSRSDHPASLYGIDAAFIAFRYGLPTLNGYSAFAPPDWELGEPHGAEYLDQVRRWVARADLRDVCALDIETRQIVPFETAEGREP